MYSTWFFGTILRQCELDENTIPHNVLHTYNLRCPRGRKDAVSVCPAQRDVRVGQRVFVKPKEARCTTLWKKGLVTAVTNEGAVEVNGVHRHVACSACLMLMRIVEAVVVVLLAARRRGS